MRLWQEAGYVVEITADGSPTLRSLAGGESMHHSGGALAETLEIYGRALTEVFQKIARPGVHSLGLGLGYNELLTAALSQKFAQSYDLITSESEAVLSQLFLAWLADDLEVGDIQDTYDWICLKVAKAMNVEPSTIKANLRQAQAEGRWRLAGALGPQQLPEGSFHCFLFDAFSSKTSPDLWTEDFLKSYLQKLSQADALLATYACTGNLKRSLKQAGYQLVLQEGFQGKKNSTLGRRGLFTVS